MDSPSNADIEVTPAMMAAGVSEYDASFGFDGEMFGSTSELVAEIYRAMHRAMEVTAVL